MRRILFATDFSDSCDNAFKYLQDIIDDEEIEIDIINVYDIPVTTLLSITHKAVQGMIEERGIVVTNMLNDMILQLPENNRGKIYSIYGSHPANEISQLSKTIDYTIIVMALRQKYSFFDRIMGTVTAQTIHQAHTPVLAIPSGAKFQDIKTILFPTSLLPGDELKEEEEDALMRLIDFWHISNCPEINLIHVSKDHKDVDIVHKNLVFKDIDFVHTHARSVADGLFNYFNKAEAQMLAFYKPERNFWERLFHSSLTRKLLFKSRLPIIIFS
ncbi:MAG: universal stress protein [Saprospiraceae bacterium]|nr:universal stress protein [Bacteroidia bacterium]NNE14696.1 universal stress protein [Saprospiraceae bacterium]NNL91010.1 universal stress protein [Saprospiraceae bacterium]